MITEQILFIGSQHGFRPCLITFEEAPLARRPRWIIQSIKDKRAERFYDISQADKANGLQELLSQLRELHQSDMELDVKETKRVVVKRFITIKRKK